MKVFSLSQNVDCDCIDQRLSRPILLYNRYGEQQVYSCLRCGAITCVHPMGDEPRGGGPAGGNNFEVPLKDEVTKWLGLWPRLLTLGSQSNQPLWVAVDERFETWSDLQTEIERVRPAQSAFPPAQRLLAAMSGRLPIPEPPVSLPPFLRFYRMTWQAMSDPKLLAEFLATCGCER